MTYGASVKTLIPRLAARGSTCVVAILVISAALRCAVALWLPAEIVWVDGERYVTIAENLRAGHGFGTQTENRLSVPTQPLLIAAVQLVFGKSFTALRLFFALMGSATCVLGYLLAKELFDPVVALIAGVLLAIYPAYIYLFALFEYPQPFFIFAMSIAFLMLYQFIRSRRVLSLLVAGVSLGLAALSVPTALVFIPALLLSLWLGRVPQLAHTVTLLLVAAAVPVGAWALRNYLAYGEFVLVNQAAGTNFWAANNSTYFEFGKVAVIPPCGPGNEHHRYCGQWQSLNDHLRAAHLSVKRSIAADEAAGWRNGWAFIRDSPARTVILSLRKILEFWSPKPDAVTTGRANAGSAKDWIAILSYTPMLLLAILGIGLSAQQARRLLPIYAYFLTFTAVYAVFLPTTRYRLPLDFFLIIFAASALKRGCELLTLRGSRAAEKATKVAA
jgi:4-amino-4-deoxy-L-arabinose transferase-like glycosyltransferase